MLLKILKNDLKRNKVISLTLLLFILLSSFLVSSGTYVVVELLGAIDNLFSKADVPHFVQMHAGELNHSAISSFASSSDLVSDYQLIEMLNIDGSSIYFGNSKTPESNSVMDNGFIQQNKSFDYLLNLNNEIIEVSEGEIAVPIYYMLNKQLNLGDKFTIKNGNINRVFTITDFVRDVQMNPSIVSSKRFVINNEDFKRLKSISRIEYLIEFKLKDLAKLSDFSTIYADSNLPKKGPTVDYSLFKIVNALSDGLVVAIILIVSILLILIALLCLRFTILTTIEEDYKEIGVLKAIGIKLRDIKRIYLFKYIFLTATAAIGGYLLSLCTIKLFTVNISLYIGTAKEGYINYLLPLLASIVLFIIVILFCLVIIKRFKNISAIEALRSGVIGTAKINNRFFNLHKHKSLNTNLFLGIKDVLARQKMYFLLLIIFIICSFIITVPLNFLSTLKSPSFISYMGVGRCDIRIDLQQSPKAYEQFTELNSYLMNDEAIEKHSAYVTSRYKVLNTEDSWEYINIETGDYTKFPLTYLQGSAPTNRNEIALSHLNAEDLNKSIGDKLTLLNGTQHEMTITGIYQDVTNGGKTAKAILPANLETTQWYTVNINIKEGTNLKEKLNELQRVFSVAKVTDIENYLNQTLGTTVNQIQLITKVCFVIASIISILITSLFVRMVIAKDTSQIAIMRSIGFTMQRIQVQYIIKTIFILAIAITIGVFLSNSVGEGLVSFLMSFMGASKISLVINPLLVYVLIPISLIIIVTVTTIISSLSIKKVKILNILG